MRPCVLRWEPLDAGSISTPKHDMPRLLLGKEIQICDSQPFKRTEPAVSTKLDFEEAIVTALLAVGMIILAALTIMIFF
jgi:hypothetical protein